MQRYSSYVKLCESPPPPPFSFLASPLIGVNHKHTVYTVSITLFLEILYRPLRL